MNLYLKNILPRVAQYSKDLSRKELFVDQPWVIVDDAGNHQKYIFERNGRLIISNNGNVSFGTWEYLSTAKSLLLVTENQKLLLNQGFIDSPVMILKRDGVSSEEMLLANENLLPDLDIEGYFRMLFIESNKITIHETITGHQIEIHGTMGSTYERLLYLQKLITIDGEGISDTYIEMKDNDQILQIQNSHVVKVLTRRKYNTNQGLIWVEVSLLDFGYGIERGNRVYNSAGYPAEDGKYKLNFFNHIQVIDGRVA